jgi:hypothetical protein
MARIGCQMAGILHVSPIALTMPLWALLSLPVKNVDINGYRI